MIPAVAYLRTSSAANVGADKDSDKRQLAAVAAYAESAGYEVIDSFYDAAVSGADPLNERPGFVAMLERIKGNGVRTILVESPDRFARDLTVQLLGHDMLKREGIVLIPASAPSFFLEDTPTAVMVRQILGAVAEFEKANLVAKLQAARQRKAKAGGKAHGRYPLGELRPGLRAAARKLYRPEMSLRELARRLAEAGHVSAAGTPLDGKVVARLIAWERAHD